MIKVDNNTIGFIYINGKLIDMIYIDPQYRNKGYGYNILKSFTKNGSVLKTKSYNKTMISLAKKSGYKIKDKNNETITWIQ